MIKTPIRRLGKKNAVLPYLLPYFPAFDVWIEPFAGSGAVGLNINAKYKFLNDLDADIYNFWRIMCQPDDRDALIAYIELMPYSDAVWQHLKDMQPANDIEKAARFLVISGWGYMGKPDTLKIGLSNNKQLLLNTLVSIQKDLAKGNIIWSSKDFRDFLPAISLRENKDSRKIFIYCDPPYLGTRDNYNTPTWTAQDLRDLVVCCVAKGCNFAISEFENDTVLSLKEEYGLNLYVIKERRNLKNEATEILLTNYEVNNSLF